MLNFMGKKLKSSLIASSCIATENTDNILRLEEHGIGGAILKSCADYTREECAAGRNFAFEKSTGYTYASSPFSREIMTLGECTAMLRELRPLTDMLLIPSFTAESLSPEAWLPACAALESLGADGIQLDFFYMSCLIGQDGFGKKLAALLSELLCSIRVPIMPKLNVDLPKDFIIPLLKKSGVEYVSLLDSVRSPYLEYDASSDNYNISGRLPPQSTSCFGSWQLPLTLGYTYTAANYGLHICAGGGVTFAGDVKKLIAAGAETVQSASFLTKYPYRAKELLAACTERKSN